MLVSTEIPPTAAAARGMIRIMNGEESETGQPELRFYYYINPDAPPTLLMQRLLMECPGFALEDDKQTGQPRSFSSTEFFDDSVPDPFYESDNEEVAEDIEPSYDYAAMPPPLVEVETIPMEKLD